MSKALAVGVMSGTSLDGISTALVRLEDDAVELVAFRQEPYSSAERGSIIDAAWYLRAGACDRECKARPSTARHVACRRPQSPRYLADIAWVPGLSPANQLFPVLPAS